MFTCRDGKGGELSSQASKILYKLPGAVYIASYKVPLDQSDCRKLFVQLWNYTKKSIFKILLIVLTLFRLGFFGQSVTGGWLLGPPPPPSCISGTNNARVMKFTHNDHLDTKKPQHPVLTCHTQWWRHSDVIFRFFNFSYHFSTQIRKISINIGKLIFFAILSYELVTRKHLVLREKAIESNRDLKF